jgi:hypothetical protein
MPVTTWILNEFYIRIFSELHKYLKKILEHDIPLIDTRKSV